MAAQEGGGAPTAGIAPRGDGRERLRRVLAGHGYTLMMVGAAGVIYGGSGSDGAGEPVAGRAKMLLSYVMWMVGCGSVLFSVLLP